MPFPAHYIRWHYSHGVTNFIQISENLMRGVWRIFAIPTLFRTLLTPWSRLHEEYETGAGIGDWLGVFIVNSLMRIVGAVVRVVVIAFGLVSLIVSSLFFVAGLVVWLLWPVVLVLGFFLIFYSLPL
jgi:hypothetical protein